MNDDNKHQRRSMFAPAGTPMCETCPRLQRATNRHGGWCLHPSNRVVSEGWPHGFTPSVSWDGTCTLHPERASERAASLAEQGERDE